MMALTRFALLCTLPVLALGAVKRAPTGTFGLWGYGRDGIGGLQLYYADGYAYLGSPGEQSNITDAAVALFTRTSDRVWTASPNGTGNDGQVPDWSNVTFYVPDSSATDHRVGFLSSNETADNVITSGFNFYGSTASLIGDNGQLETRWFVLNETGKPHALYWNDTSLGQVEVILRSVAPSNPNK